jgi:hypothetical protein
VADGREGVSKEAPLLANNARNGHPADWRIWTNETVRSLESLSCLQQHFSGHAA